MANNLLMPGLSYFRHKLFEFQAFHNQAHIINFTGIIIYFCGTYYLYAHIPLPNLAPFTISVHQLGHQSLFSPCPWCRYCWRTMCKSNLKVNTRLLDCKETVISSTTDDFMSQGSLSPPKRMNFRKISERGGGGHFRSKKFHCNFFYIRNGNFGHEYWGKNRNEIFRKRGAGGGSKAVRKFSGNSFESGDTGFPQNPCFLGVRSPV